MTIKLVATELVQTGIKITVIDPFEGLSADQESQFKSKIQVGTDPKKGDNCRIWTVESIQKATEFKGYLPL